jgi:hypothetical protein
MFICIQHFSICIYYEKTFIYALIKLLAILKLVNLFIRCINTFEHIKINRIKNNLTINELNNQNKVN